MNTPSIGGPVGARLLPVAIDEISQQTPNKIWALLSREKGNGWDEVNFSTFANAINTMAWFVVENFGRVDAKSFPTFCYIGEPDMRYQVMEMAAAKAGYQVCTLIRLALH